MCTFVEATFDFKSEKCMCQLVHVIDFFVRLMWSKASMQYNSMK